MRIYEIYQVDTEDPEFFDLSIGLYVSYDQAWGRVEELNKREEKHQSAFRFKLRGRELIE